MEGSQEYPIWHRAKWIRESDTPRFHVVITDEIVARQLVVFDGQIFPDDGTKLERNGH